MLGKAGATIPSIASIGGYGSRPSPGRRKSPNELSVIVSRNATNPDAVIPGRCQRVRATRGPMTGSASNPESRDSPMCNCTSEVWCLRAIGVTKTRLGLLHKRSKGRGVVRMPARQGRAVFNDVARRPEDPPLVKTSGHVVIGAQNVKVAGIQPLDHEVDGLLRSPGPGRLLGAALGGKPGEYKTRNHQVRGDPGARRVSQLVLQRLGEGFDACLGNIIRGVARWRRDALLRAGIDDEAGAPALDHARCKDLRPVNHAPEVHADNAGGGFGGGGGGVLLGGGWGG